MTEKEIVELLLENENLVAADLIYGKIDNAINSFFGNMQEWIPYDKNLGIFVFFWQNLREKKFQIGFGDENENFSEKRKEFSDKLKKGTKKLREEFKNSDLHDRGKKWIYYEFTCDNTDKKTLEKIKQEVRTVLSKLSKKK